MKAIPEAFKFCWNIFSLLKFLLIERKEDTDSITRIHCKFFIACEIPYFLAFVEISKESSWNQGYQNANRKNIKAGNACPNQCEEPVVPSYPETKKRGKPNWERKYSDGD